MRHTFMKLAAAALLIGTVAGAGMRSTWSAFSGTTGNAANSFQTATTFSPYTLELTPETGSCGVGPCTVTATLSEVPGADVHVDFELESGPGDTDGNSPSSPDATCLVIGGSGNTCFFLAVSAMAGTQTWRGWIDADNNDSTVEADTSEGPDESVTPGSPGEPDVTDVVALTYS